jgi:cobalt/nickel transport protein
MSASTAPDPQAPARPGRRRPRTRGLVVVGLLVCALLAGVASSWASTHPDGLERVAATLGFDSTAAEPATAGSPLSGYAVEQVEDPTLSSGLAGVVGIVVVGAVMAGLLLLLRRRHPSGTDA